MTFFSLLYESKEQMLKLKEKAKQHPKGLLSQKDERKYEYIGNKMVALQEKKAFEEVPLFYKDLNLNQITEDIFPIRDDEEYRKLFFEVPNELSLIIYWQDILKDLDKDAVFEGVNYLLEQLQLVQKLIGYKEEVTHEVQRIAYQLEAMIVYYEAIVKFINLVEYRIASKGLQLAIGYMKALINTEQNIWKESENLYERLKTIHYTMKVSHKEVSITITCEETMDDREKADDNNSKKFSFFNQITYNNIEQQIGDYLLEQCSTLFNKCKFWIENHKDFYDSKIGQLRKDLYFYFQVILYKKRLKERGLFVTYPMVSKEASLKLSGMYDLALARKLMSPIIIKNSIELGPEEYGAWITGANQGGKTTYLRSLGQSIVLALQGLFIPASKAQIPLYQGICTHFSTEESTMLQNSKLQEELMSIKTLLETSDEGKWMYLFNELFSSTTSVDAYELSQLLIKRLLKQGHHIFCVTHVPSLTDTCPQMISLVAEVLEDTLHTRTYTIARKPAGELAYASTIAKKYGLTKKEIKEAMAHGKAAESE